MAAPDQMVDEGIAEMDLPTHSTAHIPATVRAGINYVMLSTSLYFNLYTLFEITT